MQKNTELTPARKNQSLYGFHVEGFNVESKEIIKRILLKYRPTVTSYNNDYAGARELYDITDGETLIVHRTYQPNNIESAWTNWSASSWKEFFKKQQPGPIIQSFLNNPIVNNTQADIEAYCDFAIEVLKWAVDNNYKLALSIPINSINIEVLGRGYYDKLLLAFDDYGFRQHGHIISVKEQIPFHINIASATKRIRDNVSYFGFDTLLKPELMTESYWPTFTEINETQWHSNQFLFRSVYLNKRMDFLNRDHLPIIVSEFSWFSGPENEDYDNELNPRLNIQKEISRVYDINPSPYSRFSGIMSLRNMYAAIFKDDVNITPNCFEKRIYDQIVYLQNNSPSNYLGFCWYTLDPGSALKDINSALSYQKLLENIEPMLYDMVSNLESQLTQQKGQEQVGSNLSTSAIKSVDLDNLSKNNESPLKDADKSNSDVTEVVIDISKNKPNFEVSNTQITVKLEEKNKKQDYSTAKPKDIALSEWKAYWVSSIGLRSNIRSRADVKSNTIGKIEPEEALYYVGRQMVEIDSLGYHWIPISDFSNTKTEEDMRIKGWIREDAVQLRKYEFLYNLPVKIVVTINNATSQEVEWVKNKLAIGDIKVDIKVD